MPIHHTVAAYFVINLYGIYTVKSRLSIFNHTALYPVIGALFSGVLGVAQAVQPMAPSGGAAVLVAQVDQNDQLPAAYRAQFEQARQALSRGDDRSAYQQLSALENDLAGHPRFDLVYGQAALKVDEPTIAAFAFERCLAVDSHNELCRLGMVHAHIELNERSSAHTEINYLQSRTRSAEIQQSIARYLDLLGRPSQDNKAKQLSSYIQVGIGYDTNINSATSLSEIAIPSADDELYLLPDQHKRKKSGVMTARYHIRYAHPLNQDWRLTAQGNVAAKGNFKTSRYDNLVSDISLGIERSANQHQFAAKIKLQNYRLRNRSFRNLGSLIGQYSYSINHTTEISAFAQATKLNYSSSRYVQDNGRRNAKRYVGGLSLLKGFANERALAYVTAYGGNHRKSKSRAPAHINHNLAGLRVGGVYLVTPRVQLEAGLAVERRHFRHDHPNFLKRRKDTFYDAYLGGIYAINRKLSLRPQYQFYRNHSNIPLNRYKRHVFMLNLRYDLF